MPKQYFMPVDDAGKDLWLKNFANKLPALATKYGINGTESADMLASSQHFSYWLNHRNQYDEYTRKLTAYKNESRDGIAASATAASAAPTAPSVGGMPAIVAPGIFPRAASLAARIKNHKDYIESDGHDLGIIGSEVVVDLLQIKPSLSVRLAAGGHPEIVWHLQKMDALEIYVNRGSGYTLLDQVRHPNTLDKAELPAFGLSAIWKYKAIYRLKDQQAGQYSDEVSITVSAGL